ncbi:chaplin [Streptomyces sp. CRN 30]|uniref:chaplin n=1 Tax=Streptomyces sp. CRN 30 TaxID=3075613 RepID=UPI002A7F779E|nr:chaplin [Streptomyces sp. CRN 30]
MRRVTRIGALALAASGAMAVTIPVCSAVAADGADAAGVAAGSPGAVSGNTVQLPVDVPVNVCGNTVNVAGLLNPAMGNGCENTGGGASGDSGGASGRTPGGVSGGASAAGGGKDSPGVISGNGIQLPVELPVNVSGNSVDVAGIGNPSFANRAENGPDDRPEPPARPADPAPEPAPEPDPTAPAPAEEETPLQRAPETEEPGAATESLAETGADLTWPLVAGSTALAFGGAALYRRFRPAGRD